MLPSIPGKQTGTSRLIDLLGNNPLQVKQNSGKLTKSQFKDKAWDRNKSRAKQHLSQNTSKLPVRNRSRNYTIQRATKPILLGCIEELYPNQIINVNPGHILTAIIQPAALPYPKQWQHQG